MNPNLGPAPRGRTAAWSPRPRLRVAIVGGGASGVIAAAHLLRLGPNTVEITLIERAGAFGRGLAYSTSDLGHLLNVPAANMSALAGEPGHFVDWLRAWGLDVGPSSEPVEGCFAPRRLYGAYLASLLDGAPAGALRRIDDACVRATPTSTGVSLHLRSGGSLSADLAILATGHDLRPSRVGQVMATDAHDRAALASLGRDQAVVIVGTGLTMVDVVVTLHGRGHQGPITAISRRGLLPQTHQPGPCATLAGAAPPLGAPLSELVRWIRAGSLARKTSGGDWRGAIDALRPHTQSLWRGMTADQRSRFLRHARPWWDVRRHRMAPQIAAIIDGMRADGQLRILAGRIADARPSGGGLEISLRRRGAAAVECLRADHLVACTGAPDGPARSTDPLIRALLAEGLARPDALDLGLDVAGDSAVIDAAGRPSDRLFAVGPAARAAYWEIIAVPDIRAQCAVLAEQLATRTPGESAARPVFAAA